MCEELEREGRIKTIDDDASPGGIKGVPNPRQGDAKVPGERAPSAGVEGTGGTAVRQAAQKWEYARAEILSEYKRSGDLYINSGPPLEHLDDYLGRMGDEGWELTGTAVVHNGFTGQESHWLYFKRPKQ